MKRPVWLAIASLGIVVLLAGLVGYSAVWAQTAKTRSRTKATTTGNSAANRAVLEAQRGEWSRWRGPNGDGISYETGLLDSWPSEGPPLAWRSKGLGSGYSSVAVQGGKIFTMGDRGMDHIVCVSAQDGSVLWSTSIGGGGSNCTPTADGNLVFGLTVNGDLACCKTDDGSIVWSKSYREDFGVEGKPSWGFSESPLVDGDRLICTPGNNESVLACLDKKTGDVIWKTQVQPGQLGSRGHDGAGYSSIVIGNAGGVKQYVTLLGKGVIGVEAASGKPLWFYGNVANGTASIPTPIIAGDYVFCSSGYDTGSALIKLNKGRAGFDVEEVYFLSHDKMQNHHGGMIQKDGFVYCGHGNNQGFPLCINGKTGEDAWRPGRGPGSGSAAIAYADGHLYFRYQDGTMALIEANPKEYKLKGEFKLASRNGESWPHPVIAGGKLYLRDQDELLCYDIRKK